MKAEDLVAYLDGESPPEAQERIERDLIADPAALALFRRLCRQRLMLAQALGTGLGRRGAIQTAHPGFRVPWQMAVATALFAATLLTLWWRQDPAAPEGPQVLRGEVFAGRRAVRRIPPGTPVEVSAGSPADIRLRDGSEVVLQPLSRAVFQGAAPGLRDLLELGRGTAGFRVREGAEPFRLRTSLGSVDVGGAEFGVELVPDLDPAGKPMDSMLVRVAAGSVRVDVAGRTHELGAGEARAFRADGATADSLKELKSREPERVEKKKPAAGEPEEPRKK